MALFAVAVASSLGPAPGVAGAQQRPVLQLQSVVVAGPPWFAGAGVGAGFALSLRSGIAFNASLGAEENRAAARAEALASFHLNPPGFSRMNPYLAMGAASIWSAGPDRQYLVLALGMERQLGHSLRGFLEGGLGGGLRLAAGVRAAAP